MKKVIIAIILIIVALIVWWQYKPDNVSDFNREEEIPADWKTYSNSDLGFMMKYDPRLTVRESPNVTAFYMAGRTQTEGTELYDGLAVSVNKEPVEGTFDDYVKGHMDIIKQVGEITNPLEDIKLNGIEAKTYSANSLGDYTFILIPVDQKTALSVSYIAPDPENNGYMDIVDRMLSTFNLIAQ